MKTCEWCKEQEYDERANDADRCMACLALQELAEGAGSLQELPLHEVIAEGINLAGQRFVRLRYADGSTDAIDPIPWEEEIPTTGGRIARDDEDLS